MDLIIVRNGLNHHLDDNEYYLADGGYYDGYQYAVTPTGLHNYLDRQMATLRARHETVNWRLKEWQILKSIFRHRLERHSYAFRAVANIVQYSLQTDRPTWQCHWDEHEFIDEEDDYDEYII